MSECGFAGDTYDVQRIALRAGAEIPLQYRTERAVYLLVLEGGGSLLRGRLDARTCSWGDAVDTFSAEAGTNVEIFKGQRHGIRADERGMVLLQVLLGGKRTKDEVIVLKCSDR